MSIRKSFPVILLLLYAINFSSEALTCRHECSKRKCKDNYLDKSLMINSGNNSYICPSLASIPIAGSANKNVPYVIGWSDQCAIPAGSGEVSNASCLSTNNFFNQAISTALTVGIGIDMRNNFCSFVPGDTLLEGAIISNDFLNNCKGQTLDSNNKCLRNLLKGKDINEQTIGPSWFSGNKVTNNPCNGIPNLDRPVIDYSGNFVLSNGKQVYCPLMRCNIPTDYMAARYYGDKAKRTQIMASTAAIAGAAWGGGIGAGLGAAGGAFISAVMPACCDNPNIGSGTYGYTTRGVDISGMVKLKASNKDDKVCTEMLIGPTWVTMGCKFKSPPVIKMQPRYHCKKLHEISCSDSTKIASKSFMPITSRMMQCVTELLYVVFKWGDCSVEDVNPIAAFQERMRDVVQVLLVLYVIFFGIKVALGDIPRKSDLWIFILKIGLISYFVIGGFTLGDANSAANVNKNGLELLLDGALGAMNDFANIVSGNDSADTNSSMSLCKYNKSQYSTNSSIGLDYSFLALWDSFDCRLMFYMGFANPTEFGKTIAETPLIGSFSGGFISLIWALLFSWNWLFLIFILIFSILLLSITIFLAHIYIIALIAVTITIYMGPIFIPMSLFSYTKKYFDEWLKLLISYTLQPAVIIAFIVLMNGVIDEVVYKGCMDSGSAFTQSNLSNGKPYWIFQDPLPQYSINAGCNQSLGYKTAHISPGADMQVSNFMSIFPIYILKKSSYDFASIKQIMIAAFFMFLFYYFAQQLASFAADVSQSPNLGGQAIGATTAFDAAADAVSSRNYHKAKKVAKSNTNVGDTSNKKGISVSNANRKGISVSSSKSTG